jgi:hypothetical protein
MPGEPDQLYVDARRALLDALDALGPHATALVLVGAQAVYIHTGDAEVAVAATTKDGDLAVDPRELKDQPSLEAAMVAAGFRLSDNPGIWLASDTGAEVDLLVPESLAFGTGRRAARIPGHGASSARRVVGLEAAIVDNEAHTLTALEPLDGRALSVRLAGPAALLVAKLHKVGERRESPDRLVDKDALDIYRLLAAVSTLTLTRALQILLADPISASVTRTAVTYLGELFGSANVIGSRMAARAVEPLMDGDTIAQSSAALAQDLLEALEATAP